MTRKNVSLLCFAAALGLVLSFAGKAQSPSDRPLPNEFQSYLAHIAAAATSLQLHDTAAAKRWLAGAPVRYRDWEWRYLSASAEQSTGIFAKEQAAVTAIAVSPDGKFVATTSSDKVVTLFNAATKAEIWRAVDEKLVPMSVAFSPEGKQVAIGYSGHLVRILDLARGAETRSLQGSGRGITAVTFNPDGKWLAACSWKLDAARKVQGVVEIWDAATGASMMQLQYGVKPLTAIAFSPDGKYLAVGGWEVQKTVAFWEVGKWGEPAILDSEATDAYKAVQAIAFSSDSKLLAAGGKDSVARIWEIGTRKLKHVLGGRGWGHSKWVNSVAFSPDRKTLATVSTDQTLRLWDVESGNERSLLHGHTKDVRAVAFASNGKTVYTAAGDKTVRTWDVGDGTTSGVWTYPGTVYGIGFDSYGSLAVTAGWLGRITVRDAGTGRVMQEWPAHEQSSNAVAFSADGRRLASVGNDSKVKIWDTGSQRELHAFTQPPGEQLISIAFSPDGARVVSAFGANQAKVWDVESGTVRLTLNHPNGVTCVAHSLDGKRIATGGKDGSVILWDAETGVSVGTLRPHTAAIATLAFSRNSQWLLAASGDRTASVSNVAQRKVVRVLSGHDEAVNCANFSPDGNRVVSVSEDQTLKIWDTGTGVEILTRPLTEAAYRAVFHPDGNRLFLSSYDRTVRILMSQSR